MNSMLLPIGPITLELKSREEQFIPALMEYFIFDKTDNKPEISITLKFETNPDSGAVPNSLFLTKEKMGNFFYTGNRLIKIVSNPDNSEFTLLIDSRILEGEYVRIFEQILYQASTTAIRRSRKNINLIHSSSVKKDDSTYLFVGKSETGKSTVAKLSSMHHVLNDEISVVEQKGEGVTLYGSPFNGLFREKKPGAAPLKAILLLRQAKFHKLTRTSSAEAVKTLANEIIPPVGLDELLKNDTYFRMLDISAELCRNVPVYHLDFLPNPGFWEAIEKELGR